MKIPRLDNWSEHNAQLSHQAAPWNAESWVKRDPQSPKTFHISTPTADGSIPISSLSGTVNAAFISMELNGDPEKYIDALIEIMQEQLPNVEVRRTSPTDAEFYKDGALFGSVSSSQESADDDLQELEKD